MECLGDLERLPATIDYLIITIYLRTNLLALVATSILASS